jgi:hypothetical protein
VEVAGAHGGVCGGWAIGGASTAWPQGADPTGRRPMGMGYVCIVGQYSVK